MRRSLLAVLVLLALPSGAAAEAGFGPPVNVSLALNHPLEPALRARVDLDNDFEAYSAKVHAYLNVGTTTVADLGEVDVPASTAPSTATFAVAPDAIAAARNRARKVHLRRATVAFVITPSTDRTGPQNSYSEESSVRLTAAVRPRGDTHLRRAELFRGTSQTFAGDVRVTTPASWLRSSFADDPVATFLPPPAELGCEVNVVVQPIAIAARSAAEATAQVRAIAGVRRTARHRYAGARIDVQYAADCRPPSGWFLAELQGVARSVRVVPRGR